MARARVRVPKAAPVAPRLLPSSRERVLWLLRFLQQDLATMTAGQRMDFSSQARRYLHDPAAVDTTAPDVYTAALAKQKGEPVPEPPVPLEQLHAELTQGLSTLNTPGLAWVLNKAPRVVVERAVESEDDRAGQAHRLGRLVRRYRADPLTLLTVSAADLLIEWSPHLRRCQRDTCGALFLPRHGRQKFHDPACAFRSRWAKYASKRTRDYHDEYARRVKKVVGPGARPQRRTKKGSGQ